MIRVNICSSCQTSCETSGVKSNGATLGKYVFIMNICHAIILISVIQFKREEKEETVESSPKKGKLMRTSGSPTRFLHKK